MINKCISEDIKKIINKNEGKKGTNFYIVKNSEGKQWIFQNGSFNQMRVDMCIYQPSNIKGNIFKLLFPIPLFRSILKKLLGVEIVSFNISNWFKNWIDYVFNQKDIRLSFFEGTPCIHQKTTIQVSNNKGKILGYIKLTHRDIVAHTICNEANALRFMFNKGLPVPELMGFNHNFINGITLIAQSTKKTLNSKIKNNLCKDHYLFLEHLFTVTKEKVLYEKTQYYINQQQYLSNIAKLNSEQQQTIKNAINIINSNLLGKIVEFSYVNRDFTPWNICFTQGSIFVFDWEYATNQYPPTYDLFHFITQKMLLVDKLPYEKIINENLKLVNNLSFTNIEKINIYYLMYIVDICLFYLNRDTGINLNINNWISIINILLKKEM